MLNELKKKIAVLKLFESRIKYAALKPSNFLPRALLSFKLQEIDANNYAACIDWELYSPGWIPTPKSIEEAASTFSKILLNAVVLNQNNCWLLITQIELYFKDKSFDDVAFTTKNDNFVDELTITMDKQVNEGGGSWCELRVTFGKFEAIATGGLIGDSDTGITPFLGVGVPSVLASDDSYILLSPTAPVPQTYCHGMLCGYQRKQGVNMWCFNSSPFCSQEFSHTIATRFVSRI